jgi:lipopolysaccharide export system permease protein
MRLLDRYIGVHILSGTALALAVLLSVFSFIDFIDDLDSVGKGTYTATSALLNSVLTMPGRAFALFPPAALIGTLLGLGSLAASRELVVMRSAGISVHRITGSVMKSGLILVVLSVIIGELVAPQAAQIAVEQRTSALRESLSMMTRFGSWLRDGQSFVNIRKVSPDGVLEEIYIYDFDENLRLRAATRADGARHLDDHWQLTGIVQSSLTERAVETREVERARWNSKLVPDMVNVSSVAPESLSAFGLVTYLDYLRANGLSTPRFELALWNKLIYPLATAVMIYLAAAMVLSRSSPMVVGQRIVVGALAGVGFHILHNTSVRVGLVYELSPLLTAALPTLAFTAVAAWLVHRAE